MASCAYSHRGNRKRNRLSMFLQCDFDRRRSDALASSEMMLLNRLRAADTSRDGFRGGRLLSLHALQRGLDVVRDLSRLDCIGQFTDCRVARVAGARPRKPDFSALFVRSGSGRGEPSRILENRG